MEIKETRPTEVVVEVICDGCGESCTKDREQGVHEYATLAADWGYDSKHDGESYRYELCETCFYQVLAYLRERPTIITKNYFLIPFSYVSFCNVFREPNSIKTIT